MSNIYGIALNTYRESLREKLLYLVIIYAGVLLVSTYILSPFSVGAGRGKIVTDIGLATISIFGVITAIMVGSRLVHKEIDKKAVFMVITRPVSRVEYIAGKFAGIMMALGALTGLMTAVMLAVMLVSGVGVSGAVVLAVLLTIIEIALIASIVIFFSTFTTPILTSFFSICIFAAGSLSNDLRAFAEKFGGETMKTVISAVYFLLPNMATFNLRHEAVHGLRYSHGEVLLPVLYGLAYIAAMLYFAYLVFRRREFS